MEDPDTERSALARLHRLIEAEGGPLAETLVEASRVSLGGESFGSLAAAGERAGRDPREYALLVESILEGYLVHFGPGRLLETSDPDLRLLGGDYLYALGLARLARLGDLEAVEELASLISLCAQAHAEAAGGEAATGPWRLTRALWALAALAVGTGGWPEQRRAKEAIRTQRTGAADLALDAARARARSLGLGTRLEDALIAFDQSFKGELSAT